jgi:hypothetical protein
VPEGALLKVLSWILVFRWMGGSFSLQSLQIVKASPFFVILQSASAQSRLSPKTKVSSDMDVTTGK